MNRNLKNKGIVLFDGYCNLCSGSVNFIIKRNKKDYFRFASLQSEIGQEYNINRIKKNESYNSVILIENNQIYDKSTAALRITKNLKGFWFLFYIFIVVPRPIRDFIYMLISKNRYKWFGKKTECFLPDENYKHYFLDTNHA
jgi:predicted DCC family thiol-disulfide oxidoreductase YuxK